MTTTKHLKRNDDLDQFECWKQIVDVYGEHTNLKVLKKMVDEVVKVTGIPIKREQYRKKKGYVEYLQEHWEVVERIALGITIDPEDIKQGPLAQKHKKDYITTIIQPQQMFTPQATAQQTNYLQIQNHQILQVHPIQNQVSLNILDRSQNDEIQRDFSNIGSTSNQDFDFNGMPDENMYNFFDFHVRSDDDFYI